MIVSMCRRVPLTVSDVTHLKIPTKRNHQHLISPISKTPRWGSRSKGPPENLCTTKPRGRDHHFCFHRNNARPQATGPVFYLRIGLWTLAPSSALNQDLGSKNPSTLRSSQIYVPRKISRMFFLTKRGPFSKRKGSFFQPRKNSLKTNSQTPPESFIPSPKETNRIRKTSVFRRKCC